MKKSEMAERMRKHFNTEYCDQIALLAYQIIDFLEQQGMLPPTHESYEKIPASFMFDDVYRRVKVNKWEDEE